MVRNIWRCVMAVGITVIIGIALIIGLVWKCVMTVGIALIIGLVCSVLIIILGAKMHVWDHDDTHTYS